MKRSKRALLIGVVAIVASIAYMLLKRESDFGRPWQVDIEASVSKIEVVPDIFKNRYPSVDAYRDYVRERGRGLTLTIYENGTAALGRGEGAGINLVWREDDHFDYWLTTKSSWLFSGPVVGHGFDRVSSDTASLKFQLEYSESLATREFLHLRR